MSSATDAAARPKRVLLAEDDDVSRRVLATVLMDMGFEVIESRDGGRLLVAITAQYRGDHDPTEIDLVVTDVNMPVVSGTDILRGLRAAHWRTPVIIVTGNDSQAVRDAVALGRAELVLKPIDLDEFERKVRGALDGSRPTPRVALG